MDDLCNNLKHDTLSYDVEDLSEFLREYENKITSKLDKSTTNKKRLVERDSRQWYTNKLREQKQTMRNVESKWANTKWNINYLLTN